MFFVASKILDFITNPLSWILITLLLSVFLKKPGLKKRFLLATVFMLLFFSNPWITNKAISAWEIDPINSNSITEIYDVGIVLGGSMRYYDNTTQRVVYSSSVDRLLQTIDLYHRGKIKKILLSGGSGYVNFPDWKESVFLKKVLEQCNIPEGDILMENNSRNTRENALESAAVLKSGTYGNRFLLITSATHMRRSLACFDKVGLKPDPYAVDVRSGVDMYTLDKLIIPDTENISNWDILIHEWLGMLMYKMAGYI
ncbi:MAG: YdcF family protein [Bacteroidota bacterium]